MPDNLPEQQPETNVDSIDDVLDKLSELDKDDAEDKSDDLDDKSDKTDDDSADDDKDDDEPDDDDELDESKLNDDKDYEEIPTRESLKKAYPDIFKKHPGLERAIFREHKYTEIFPSIEDASKAKDRLEDFNQVQSQLLDGNIDDLLSQVKTASPEAFGKISGKILQTLHKVDKEAYFGTVNHILQHALTSAITAAGQAEDKDEGEQLAIAAKLINKFLYGTTKIEAPKAVSAEPKKDDSVSRERAEFEQTQLNTAVQDVSQSAFGRIRRTVDKYIDPQKRMSPYVRDKAIEDVLKEVDRAIATDSRFRGHLDKQWSEAKKVRYQSSSRQVIIDSILKKANSTLPEIIKRVRMNALKNEKKAIVRKKQTEEDDQQPVRHRREAAPDKDSSKPRVTARTSSQVFDILNKD